MATNHLAFGFFCYNSMFDLTLRDTLSRYTNAVGDVIFTQHISVHSLHFTGSGSPLKSIQEMSTYLGLLTFF